MSKFKMNLILSISSFCMFFSTILNKKRSSKKLFYTLGNTTSILNHSTTSNFTKNLDRTVMCIGAGLDLYFIKQRVHYLYLFLSISSFFMAKKKKKVIWHVSAHFWITILHNQLI